MHCRNLKGFGEAFERAKNFIPETGTAIPAEFQLQGRLLTRYKADKSFILFI